MNDEKKSDAGKEQKSGFPKLSAMHVVIAIAVIVIAVIFIAKFGFGTDLLSTSSGEMAIVKRPITPVPTIAQKDIAVRPDMSLRPVTIASCDAPKQTCGDSCVDIKNDPNNCGRCGRVCAQDYAGNNNVAAYGCSEAKCTVTSCKPGFANCRGNIRPDVGAVCESNLMDGKSSIYNQYDQYVYQQRDPTNTFYVLNSHNCGSCGNYCEGGSSYFGICDNGACRQVCWGVWLNCDGTMTNGCEQDMDENNCGACGAKCPANAICKDGCCVIQATNSKVPDSLGVTCSGNLWQRMN